MLRLLVCAPLVWAGVASAQTGKLIFPDETDSLVLQWGTDTVNDFLAAHQMPAAEVTSIDLYARQDLRDNLRAFAWSKLQMLLADPQGALDAVEQRMVNRFSEVVKAIGIEHLKIAMEEKNRFVGNRCVWKPDADLAKSSGFTFDGSYYCPRLPYQVALDDSPPLSPTKDYFIALGQKKAWVETISARPGGARSIAHISQGGLLFLAIGLPAALVMGVVFPLVGISNHLFAIKVLNHLTQKVTWVSRSAGFWVGIGISLVLMALTITVLAFLYTENNRIEAEYTQLDNQYNAVANNPAPSRTALAVALGSGKDGTALYAALLRMAIPTSTPLSPAALPTPGASEPQFLVRAAGSSTGSLVSTITFPGWDGERTRAKLWRGWILQEALVPLPSIDLTSMNSRIRYQWSGKKYEASRIGSTFAVRKVLPADTDVDCPIDRASLVSTPSDATRCKAFVTRDLPMDFEGLGTRNVSVTQAITFTSSPSAKVAGGQAFAIPITTAGLPEPTISAQGSLPAGFTLSAGTLLGTATLNFSGAGNLGTHDIILVANNGVETKQMTLQVSVSDSVKFTSPGETSYTMEAGKYVSIPIVATGFPAPTVFFHPFTTNCCLQLEQVSGSAYRLFGHIQPAPAPFKCFFVFEAANANAFEVTNPARGRAFLDMSIVVTEPARQPYVGTREIDTPIGLPRQYRIETFGTSSPVSISLTTGSNGQQLAPPWVYLNDQGNGTAILSVTPPLDAPGVVLIPLWYRVTGTEGNQATSATEGITLNVFRKPLWFFSGSDIGRFDVGSPVDQHWGAQAQDATGNVTFTVSPKLPDGLQLVGGAYGALDIFGKATTPGDYDIEITATNPYGSSSFQSRIIVAQAAKITSPQIVNFYLGRNNTFDVTAAGFPLSPLGEHKVIPAPMSFSHRSQWVFDVLGLRFDTKNAATQDPYFGRVVISGNPSANGKYPVELSAQTAGLAADNQQLLIVATAYGDVNSDLTVNCGDVSFITSRIGRRRGSPQYDYNADINQDGVIDVRDLSAVSSRLPSGTRCQ